MSTRIPRITKKVRDEAIELCLVAASCNFGYGYLSRVIGYSEAATDLAFEAWAAAYGEIWSDRDRTIDARTVDAEAAALLEDGWSPGQPVEVIAR